MTVRIEKYRTPQEFLDAFMEIMNNLSNHIRKDTGAPEGACATTAIMIAKGIIESMEDEINRIYIDEGSETRH